MGGLIGQGLSELWLVGCQDVGADSNSFTNLALPSKDRESSRCSHEPSGPWSNVCTPHTPKDMTRLEGGFAERPDANETTAPPCTSQGNMPKRRQLVVKDAYERLSANFGGCVTLDVIQRVSGRAFVILYGERSAGRVPPGEVFAVLDWCGRRNGAVLFFCRTNVRISRD